MENRVEISRYFRAMNTDVEVVVCVPRREYSNGEAALINIRTLFDKMENSLSRFNSESELAGLNRSAGSWLKVSPLLFEVVQASLKAASLTEGVFDPTILTELLAAGYNNSFEKLAGGGIHPGIKCLSPKFTWKDIQLDVKYSSIFIPEGSGIDLGGIGKGWTVDMAAKSLEKFSAYAVDAGGDIRVKGFPPGESAWTVGVADPRNENCDLSVFELQRGAVCTSTTTRRKWMYSGQLQHHLIDPRSGEPSRSGVISATVIAESATKAEIISKTALILGPEEGLKFINQQFGTRGLLVLEDGKVLCSKVLLEKELQYAA